MSKVPSFKLPHERFNDMMYDNNNKSINEDEIINCLENANNDNIKLFNMIKSGICALDILSNQNLYHALQLLFNTCIRYDIELLYTQYAVNIASVNNAPHTLIIWFDMYIKYGIELKYTDFGSTIVLDSDTVKAVFTVMP